MREQSAPDSAAAGAQGGQSRKYLVLTAMIFAVAMTFIDQTIVSIGSPEIQRDLGLTSTGIQWVINGYLLSLAALFAFGGRLSDILGHRKMVVIGVVVFAGASTLCGLTPKGSGAEAWIVTFRVLQGAGGAIMYPAALAIVVDSFPLRERGRAMAVFFGVAGGLTAIGPILGGYLTEWTWRAIFWINVPVAIVALVLTALSRPEDSYERAPLDYPGLVLIAGGMGLSVLGLQQSAQWGWSSPVTWLCITGGLGLLAGFVRYEMKAPVPLMNMGIFRSRAFLVENVVLFISMIAFIPIFFFASMYSQISLGSSVSSAGLYLLIFFAGFAPAAQVGGRILDKRGAKPAVMAGCLVAAVGLALWASSVTTLSLSSQWLYIIVSGAGIGLMLGPANTDAVNHAPRLSYGEATGITQTVRNYGSSLGLAVLGTILLSANRSRLESSLSSIGIPKSTADHLAARMSQSGAAASAGPHPSAGPVASHVLTSVQSSFAHATSIVLYVMAGVMVAAFVAALVGLRSGLQEAPEQDRHEAARLPATRPEPA